MRGAMILINILIGVVLFTLFIVSMFTTTSLSEFTPHLFITTVYSVCNIGGLASEDDF